MTDKSTAKPRSSAADAQAKIAQLLEVMTSMDRRLTAMEAQSGLILNMLPTLPPAVTIPWPQEEWEKLSERLIREVMGGVDSRVMHRAGPMIAQLVECLTKASTATGKTIEDMGSKVATAASKADAAIERAEALARTMCIDVVAAIQDAAQVGKSEIADIYTGVAELKTGLIDAAKNEIQDLGRAAHETMSTISSAAVETVSEVTESLSRAEQRHKEVETKLATTNKALARTVGDQEQYLMHLQHLDPALVRIRERRFWLVGAITGLVSAAATSVGMIGSILLAHALQVRP